MQANALLLFAMYNRMNMFFIPVILALELTVLFDNFDRAGASFSEKLKLMIVDKFYFIAFYVLNSGYKL